MTAKIAKPGAYDGVPEALYHGDLCAGPSLSSSGARVLIEQSPMHFWHQSYMNPNRPPKSGDGEKGTAAHLLLLEPDQFAARTFIADVKAWTKTADKKARDAARAGGRIPLKAHEAAELRAMRASLEQQGVIEDFLSGGVAERTYISTNAGLYWKARPDYVIDDGKTIRCVDFKTTTSAHRRDFERVASPMGYFMQEAWYRAIIHRATGRPVTDFVFITQEVDPPFAAQVFRWKEHQVEYGHMMNGKACAIFAECVITGNWPGYYRRGHAEELSMPVWFEMQIEERKANGDFTINFGKPAKASNSLNLDLIGH